jgi:predicted dienelactone hydrolase
MTATDLVLIAALAVFVVAWWVRSLPKRPAILGIAAGTAFIAGCVGVWLYRWQDGVGVVVALILLNVLGANALRQAKPRPGLPFVSGSLFVIFAALAIAIIVEFPVNPLPKPSGPFAVGVRSFELDDASRPGVLAAKPNEPRRLSVRVWYPAGDVSGLKPRPYFTPEEARTMGRSVGELVKFPPFFTYLRHVRTNSYEDAPLRPGSAHLPVIFYNHGYTSFLSQNTVLMENLASHGYVVFSVQHTYDSTATLFPNGDVAPADPKMVKQLTATAGAKPELAAMFGSTLDQRLEGQLLMREQALADKSRLTRSGGIWLADQTFVHNTLQAGAVPDAIKPIAAASDFSRVGIVGMSFGGAMSGDICVTDHRCAAGVNLDGSDFPFQTFDRAMPVPFLMFHSDGRNFYRALKKTPPAVLHSYNEFSYETLAGAGTDPNVTRVWLKGAQHIGLSDFSLFMRRPIRDPLLGTTPSKVLIGAQNDFVLGFFDRYLRGQQNGFPKPQLAAYAGWEAPLPNAEVRAWWAKKTPAKRAAIEARVERDRAGPEQMPAALSAR